MKIPLCSVFIILLAACTNRKVDDIDFYEKCRRLVLSEKAPYQVFRFSRNTKGIDEIEITYLGYVMSKNDDTLYVLNSINYTGLNDGARRGNGKVYIYNNLHGWNGFYHIGTALAVPTKIEKGNLVFESQYGDCHEITRVNLTDSIPREIFINCNDKGGDLYVFEMISL